MTCDELYELVWQTPMTKLAKRFGMSDVGLKKICKKNGIPTPPVGYWAKLANGKTVKQPPLPPSHTGSGAVIPLNLRMTPDTPTEVTADQEAVLASDGEFSSIVVPEERPVRLHPVAVATVKALRASKVDHEGFKACSPQDGVSLSIGSESVDRVLRIIDAVARALEERGYRFAEDKEGMRILVDEIPVSWRIHETRDKTEHQPTKEELKRQAREEEWRARWPRKDGSDRKVYRSWDYRPSGRLAMTFTDATKYYWRGEGKLGAWYDRKDRPLETCLDEAMKALAVGVVGIRHRLAEEAEKARLAAEAAERRRREQARRERAMKRHEFLLKKAEEFSRFAKLSALAEHLRDQQHHFEREPVDHLIDELEILLETSAEVFDRETLAGEIQSLGLYDEGDLNGISDEDEEDT